MTRRKCKYLLDPCRSTVVAIYTWHISLAVCVRVCGPIDDADAAGGRARAVLLSGRWLSPIRRKWLAPPQSAEWLELSRRLRVARVIAITPRNTLVLTAYMHNKLRLSRREATGESTTKPPPVLPPKTNFVKMDFATSSAEYIRLHSSENADKLHCYRTGTQTDDFNRSLDSVSYCLLRLLLGSVLLPFVAKAGVSVL